MAFASSFVQTVLCIVWLYTAVKKKEQERSSAVQE